ncbi:MAG: hypothetical protein Kow00122_14630 [Thermoleophilia bacterium]
MQIPEDTIARRPPHRLLLRLGLGLLLALLGGVAALALHPKTGPEVRGYIRDRFLRPGAPLPRL